MDFVAFFSLLLLLMFCFVSSFSFIHSTCFFSVLSTFCCCWLQSVWVCMSHESVFTSSNNFVSIADLVSVAMFLFFLLILCPFNVLDCCSFRYYFYCIFISFHGILYLFLTLSFFLSAPSHSYFYLWTVCASTLRFRRYDIIDFYLLNLDAILLVIISIVIYRCQFFSRFVFIFAAVHLKYIFFFMIFVSFSLLYRVRLFFGVLLWILTFLFWYFSIFFYSACGACFRIFGFFGIFFYYIRLYSFFFGRIKRERG